jgi:hypothetical protein
MGDTSPKKSGSEKDTLPQKGQEHEGAIIVRSASRGGVPVHYPQLTNMKYGVWAVKMKIIMCTLGC